MNDPVRSELERLKERQAQLSHAVDLLGAHIQAIEKRIAAGEAMPLVEKSAQPEAAAPMAVPPVLPVAQPVIVSKVPAAEPAPVSAPEENLAHASAVLLPSSEGVGVGAFEKSQDVVPRVVTPPPLPPVAFVPPTPPRTAVAPVKPDSFEMRLGTYWLVRIGIVAMLTALVFFGSYAYQNYIGKISPGGKVALLYLASGILLGFGAWFQRRAAKESLRNYAQVLLAGGMAAVYFTTYAAHHFPNLMVISSAKLDGVLLLAWAGFMAWTADRKKSEVFAMFALGLAFFSSAITHVGYFTLYSNLVLTAAALFFLVRNRWAKLSFASLIATYASYGFWRFYVNESWRWAGPEATPDLWTGIYFLGAYWAVFTAAVFLSRHKEFAGVNRATFITLNNAAFYVMFLLTMWQVHSGGFWRFNVITGAVLLGAAVFAKIRLRDEPLAANTYLTQGLLLVTVGIIAKFMDDHYTLALALALESVVLWLTGTMRKNIIMRTGSCVTAAVATLAALDAIDHNNPRGAWLGAGVGLLLAFNAAWAHWREQRNNPQLMRLTPTYFSALALLVWEVAIAQNVGQASRPAANALAVLVLVASVYLIRLRELSLLAQLLLPLAAFQFMGNQAHGLAPVGEPWWVFACVGGVALALVHWWQKQGVFEVPDGLRVLGQFMAALILVGVTVSWVHPKLNLTQWVLLNSALLLAGTAYGAVTRNWVLALVAQIFGGIAVMTFVLEAGSESLPWLPGLAPLAALTVLAFGGRFWANARPPELDAARRVRSIAVGYGRAAMALLIWWTFRYVNQPELVWSFTALGAVAFTIAGVRRNRDFLVFAAVLNLAALASLAYHLMNGSAVYWPNFIAVLAWMTEQQIARRHGERYPVPASAHNVTMIATGVSLWWLLSAWVCRDFDKRYLTANWSVFAFAALGVGIVLRERMYRWLGMVVLGFAIGRVMFVDIWKLGTIYRIISVFVLALVLMTVGFLYNKYQERLRQWL